MAAPVLRFRNALLALVVLAHAVAPAKAGEGELEGRVAASAGVDTNPTRDFISPGAAAPAPAAMASTSAALQGRYAWTGLSLQGSYEAGARAFVSASAADTLIQQAVAQAGWTALPGWTLGALLSARDREGERPYSSLLGLGSVLATLDTHASLELGAGARRFLYRGDAERFGYSFGTAVYQGTGRYRLDRHHALALGLSVEPRRYNALALQSNGALGTAARQDAVLQASASYSYKGPLFGYRRPFRLNLAYAFTQQDSNSLGQTNSRHHVTLELGVQLPGRVSLLAQGTLQFAHYPDALPLTAGLVLLDDDENTNSASLKLAYPLVQQLDVELRAAVDAASFPRNGFTYRRELVTAGLVFRF